MKTSLKCWRFLSSSRESHWLFEASYNGYSFLLLMGDPEGFITWLLPDLRAIAVGPNEPPLNGLAVIFPIFRESFLIWTFSFCILFTLRLSLSISCSLDSRFFRSWLAASTKSSFSFYSCLVSWFFSESSFFYSSTLIWYSSKMPGPLKFRLYLSPSSNCMPVLDNSFSTLR